jgi:hypothetical protein
MTHQVALTIITKIKPGETGSIKQLLKSMSSNAAQNDVIPFGQFATIHFARLLVLDESTDLQGKLIVPSLVFIGECDAPLDGLLYELVDTAGTGLDMLYRHCEGYPAGPLSNAQRLAYLRANIVPAQAFYVNTIGRTVLQIQQEARLRNAIQDFLDHFQQDWSNGSSLQVRAKILAYVRNEPTLSWASKPAAQPSILFRMKETLHMIGLPLLLLILFPALIVVLPIWLVLLRIHELRDAAPDIMPDDAHVQELAEVEDIVAQNHPPRHQLRRAPHLQ